MREWTKWFRCRTSSKQHRTFVVRFPHPTMSTQVIDGPTDRQWHRDSGNSRWKTIRWMEEKSRAHFQLIFAMWNVCLMVMGLVGHCWEHSVEIVRIGWIRTRRNDDTTHSFVVLCAGLRRAYFNFNFPSIYYFIVPNRLVSTSLVDEVICKPSGSRRGGSRE